MKVLEHNKYILVNMYYSYCVKYTSIILNLTVLKCKGNEGK